MIGKSTIILTLPIFIDLLILGKGALSLIEGHITIEPAIEHSRRVY